jgi:hypothetical protein
MKGHPPRDSQKPYEITPDLEMVIRPESVGGMPANRFVHRATNQHNIGPYSIQSMRFRRIVMGQPVVRAGARFIVCAAVSAG